MEKEKKVINSIFTKKMVVGIILGLLVIAAATTIGLKLTVFAKEEVIPGEDRLKDEQLKVSQLEDMNFYAENVSENFEFKIKCESGEADYTMFDEESMLVSLELEKLEGNEFSITPPKGGYETGKVYELILGANTSFVEADMIDVDWLTFKIAGEVVKTAPQSEDIGKVEENTIPEKKIIAINYFGKSIGDVINEFGDDYTLMPYQGGTGLNYTNITGKGNVPIFFDVQSNEMEQNGEWILSPEANDLEVTGMAVFEGGYLTEDAFIGMSLSQIEEALKVKIVKEKYEYDDEEYVATDYVWNGNVYGIIFDLDENDKTLSCMILNHSVK